MAFRILSSRLNQSETMASNGIPPSGNVYEGVLWCPCGFPPNQAEQGSLKTHHRHPHGLQDLLGGVEAADLADFSWPEQLRMAARMRRDQAPLAFRPKRNRKQASAACLSHRVSERTQRGKGKAWLTKSRVLGRPGFYSVLTEMV